MLLDGRLNVAIAFPAVAAPDVSRAATLQTNHAEGLAKGQIGKAAHHRPVTLFAPPGSVEAKAKATGGSQGPQGLGGGAEPSPGEGRISSGPGPSSTGMAGRIPPSLVEFLEEDDRRRPSRRGLDPRFDFFLPPALAPPALAPPAAGRGTGSISAGPLSASAGTRPPDPPPLPPPPPLPLNLGAWMGEWEPDEERSPPSGASPAKPTLPDPRCDGWRLLLVPAMAT